MVDQVNRMLEDARQRNLGQWIAKLKLAEDSARQSKDHPLRTYQVNYRVHGPSDLLKGNANQRRDQLTDLLRSLGEAEFHASTSTWIIKLHIPEAEAITSLLAGPLTASDYLRVAEINENRHHIGDADLET
jgi:hypothetical protein